SFPTSTNWTARAWASSCGTSRLALSGSCRPPPVAGRAGQRGVPGAYGGDRGARDLPRLLREKESLMSVQIVLAYARHTQTPKVVPYLEQQGWQVTMTQTGADALSLVEQVRPLAAIVDVHLTDMTGWEVIERVRQTSRLRSTVVILIYPPG